MLPIGMCVTRLYVLFYFWIFQPIHIITAEVNYKTTKFIRKKSKGKILKNLPVNFKVKQSLEQWFLPANEG